MSVAQGGAAGALVRVLAPDAMRGEGGRAWGLGGQRQREQHRAWGVAGHARRRDEPCRPSAGAGERGRRRRRKAQPRRGSTGKQGPRPPRAGGKAERGRAARRRERGRRTRTGVEETVEARSCASARGRGGTVRWPWWRSAIQTTQRNWRR